MEKLLQVVVGTILSKFGSAIKSTIEKECELVNAAIGVLLALSHATRRRERGETDKISDRAFSIESFWEHLL